MSQVKVGPEVSIYQLVPGTEYYGFGNRYTSRRRFRGIFVKYWRNTVGYLMLMFSPAMQEDEDDIMREYPKSNPLGLYLRVFEDSSQSYTYYRTSRWSATEKKELLERYILYKRRQYERGLTGSTATNKWLPRDLVREISLKYLTLPHIACFNKYRY